MIAFLDRAGSSSDIRGDPTLRYLARLVGGSWVTGDGLPNQPVNKLRLNEGSVFAAGSFTQIGSVQTPAGAAFFAGISWEAPGSGLSIGSSAVHDIGFATGNFVTVGNFSSTCGSSACTSLAALDNGGFSSAEASASLVSDGVDEGFVVMTNQSGKVRYYYWLANTLTASAILDESLENNSVFIGNQGNRTPIAGWISSDGYIRFARLAAPGASGNTFSVNQFFQNPANKERPAPGLMFPRAPRSRTAIVTHCPFKLSLYTITLPRNVSLTLPVTPLKPVGISLVSATQHL